LLPELLVSRKGAKTQSQDRRSTFPAIHLGAFAPLREVKTGIDEPVQNGLIGIIFFLPASVLNTVSPSRGEAPAEPYPCREISQAGSPNIATIAVLLPVARI
jgi:hypothetical protein